jgi:hypothetical protein
MDTKHMLCRFLPLLAAVAFPAFTQKYAGPMPDKPDLPYLKHASSLVATEAAVAKEDKKKDDVTYIIEGAGSSAKTPLASPIFIIQCDKISADRLGLYKLDVKNGKREIVFGPKKQPKPIRIEATRLGGNIYRIEVDESLEPGQYSLSPEGSNQVFCFEVF